MVYTIKFTGTGEHTLTVDKNSRAKIVNDALKTGGLTAAITVNKTVDFNAPKKPLSAKALAAVEKRKADRKAEKAAAEKAAKKAGK